MNCEEIQRLLEIDGSSAENLCQTLPFASNDTTVGTENEYQTSVIGSGESVDLPRAIRESSYYKNLIRRTESGDVSRQSLDDVNDFINKNNSECWENSWVSFPAGVLNSYARSVFDSDLKSDRTDQKSPLRSDAESFTDIKDGEAFIRIPVSYLLKLALAHLVGETDNQVLASYMQTMMDHYLNDNTSPEVHSFYVSEISPSNGNGQESANECLQRYLFTQALVEYANKAFKLEERGQRVELYFAPHPPIRQKKLNELISDSFYRELFINPCLSGWDKGEEKKQYMGMCHQVLSRSHLNAIAKLKEASIITNNLVVLPNTSSIGLANNGTHVSIGSKKLTSLMSSGRSGFNATHEKYLGDLTTKIYEHFQPLFVGTYTAAPYRLDFQDFHPEIALGGLAHELDFTHLRMMWRRWKKKAKIRCFGQPLTPFGPKWIDSVLSSIFRMTGDFVPDYRLIDYLVALMSTEEHSALDGVLDNDMGVKNDLQAEGVFDSSMSLYLTYKLRQFHKMGYSGFEGRYYSQFYSITDDMSHAVNLQTLISALTYKYVVTGQVSHEDISNSPRTESSRRQVFFGCAIGLPTFFIHSDLNDAFLKKVIAKTKRVRKSHRYPGFVRVYTEEYRRALVEVIKTDGADLIEMLDMHDTIADLEKRLDPANQYSAHQKLTKDICSELNISHPMKARSSEFNAGTEAYYRTSLRKRHINEAINVLGQDCRKLMFAARLSDDERVYLFKELVNNHELGDFLKMVDSKLPDGGLDVTEIERLLKVMTVVIGAHSQVQQTVVKEEGTTYAV